MSYGRCRQSCFDLFLPSIYFTKVSLGNLPSRKLRQSDTALSKDDYSNVEDYAFQPIYAFENILEGLVVFTNGLILLTIFYV